MQIKTSLMYHFTVIRIAIVKMTRDKYCQGYGENRSSVYYWWESKMVKQLWKVVWRFLKKLKIKLTCDSSIQILGTYPEFIKWISHQSTIHNSRFGNNQSWCTSEWIKKMHTHTHTQWNIIQLLRIRKSSICNNMDEPGGRYAKWNKLDRNREKQIVYIWNCCEGKPLIEIESRMVINRD